MTKDEHHLDGLEDHFWNNPSDFELVDKDEDDFERMSGEAITSIVLTITFVSFILFLICLCCPFCLLAKYRRRRGHVYGQSQIPITTAQTTIIRQNGATNTNVPHVIAINNPPRPNANYPVQQSVTVVPLLNPQPQPAHYTSPGQSMTTSTAPYPHYGNVPGHYDGKPSASMPMPDNDLPPYPGLPRETVNNAQPPYNPYYDMVGNLNASASAPPSKY